MERPVRPRFVPPPYQDSAESGRLILHDGTTAQVRPPQPSDRRAIESFLRGLPPDPGHGGYLALLPPGTDVADWLTEKADPRNGLTLIATRNHGRDVRILAAGSYRTREPGTADLVVPVADEFRGKGLGTLLLERLALLAVRNGVTRFRARTTAGNLSMLEVFRASGFDVTERASGSDVEIDLNVIPTAAAVTRSETRDRVATVASLIPFFRPKGVAVVGASRRPEAVGRRVLDAIRAAGFVGSVYPVNPNAHDVAGLRAYPSVRALPEAVDLAVIAVPAQAVPGVIDDCASRGVRAVVVISAGFAEVGEEGIARQRELVEKVRGYGMRLVGPNCLGLLNADPAVRLNTSFAPVFPPAGRVALSSQSGAVGLAALTATARYGLGISTFVSVGNKADVSGNDLLQYWEDDPATDVILLYLESFGNPRRFARIARRVGRHKPVIAMSSGRTRAGGRAAGSHTAALATNANAVEALFRQTGVIRAETLEEMFDLALSLGSQPLPRGRRVGIITNAGGPGVLCADACEAGGLSVPELSTGLRAQLAEFLPKAASIGNPVDLIAGAGTEEFRRTIAAVMSSGEVDAIIVLFTPVGLAATTEVTAAVTEAVTAARATGVTVPVLAGLLGQKEHRAHLQLAGERIPCYPVPEAPARVLGKVAAYAAWKSLPEGVIPDLDNLDLAAVRDVCRQAMSARGSCWLSSEEIQRVMQAVRLPMVPTRLARTAEDAVHAAVQFGFPVTVKLASRQVIHKSEVGGVRLGLSDPEAVRGAIQEIRGCLAQSDRLDAMDGVLVQPMMSGGVELMVGVAQDPVFGPIVAFGLGGTLVEVIADVCFRVAPLTDRDAAEMVRGVRGAQLLDGSRGHPPADLAAIQDVLLRVSRLAEEIPEISEIDINPLFAYPGSGCQVADARIHVRPAH